MLWTRPRVVLWGGSALRLPDLGLDIQPQKWVSGDLTPRQVSPLPPLRDLPGRTVPTSVPETEAE